MILLKKNFILKYFENGLIEFVQTLPWLRQLWQIHTPLSDFFKKNSWYSNRETQR